jgi:hypothetical protein
VVELAVAAAIEPVAVALPRGARDGRRAGLAGEAGVASESLGAGGAADQQRCGQGAAAGLGEQPWTVRLDSGEQLACARVQAEEFLESGAEASRRQAEEAVELQAMLLEPARAVKRAIAKARAEGRDPYEDLTPAQLTRLAVQAARAFEPTVRVERLARGQSTDNVAGHDGGPLSPDVERMDEAELTAYLTGRLDERKRVEEEVDT